MEEGSENQVLALLKDWLIFYKVPLVFGLLGAFLLLGAFAFWQKERWTAKVTFTQEATESASWRIKADIEGAIVNPGVYELASGSRIQDLLIVAGGLSAEADRDWLAKNLNLAAKLTDGAKVYILRLGEPLLRQGYGGQAGILGYEDIASKININTAGASELDRLPGVGPVTAQKIIEARPYQTVEELLTRKIVGQSIFEKIKDKISTF